MNKINHYRRLSVFITLAFILFSIYIVFDASSIWAGYKYNDEFYYLKRQSIYGVLAIIFLPIIMILFNSVVATIFNLGTFIGTFLRYIFNFVVC